jgi:hypothetical protein
MIERRRCRSTNPQRAVEHYLEAFRKKAGLEAVVLTTDDGLIIGGAGEQIDLEWMGAIGAASHKPNVSWEDRTLHVEPLSVHHFDLCLTSSGQKVRAQSLTEGLERILPLG